MLHDLHLVWLRNVFHMIFPFCYQSFNQYTCDFNDKKCEGLDAGQSVHPNEDSSCFKDLNLNFIMREISALSQTFPKRNTFTWYLIPKMLRSDILKLLRT